MPYMFSQGAANVPCTLLHFVNGELIDVAKVKIVEPGNRLFHGNPMPPDVYRVQLVRVLRGCDDVLPPYRPPGADDDDVMTLSACYNWSLLWPKSQIRLGAGDTTPQTTPPVVPSPSHGKTAATLPPSADPDMHMAQDPDGDDDTFSNIDKYINEHGYGDKFFDDPIHPLEWHHAVKECRPEVDDVIHDVDTQMHHDIKERGREVHLKLT